MIFWLLRLNVIHYNRTEGRTGDNIMVKNPDLMKRLSAYHWSHVEKTQNTVFVLLNTHSHAEQNQQIVGVFSSMTQAEQACDQLIRDQLTPDQLSNHRHLSIKEYVLDQSL